MGRHGGQWRISRPPPPDAQVKLSAPLLGRQACGELNELVWRGRDRHLIAQRAGIVLLAHEGRASSKARPVESE